MQNLTHDVSSNELPCSKKVHPESQKDSELSAGLIIKRFVQNRLKAIETGEHGKEKRVQVAGNALSILGTQKLDVGCVGPNDTLDGIFQ